MIGEMETKVPLRAIVPYLYVVFGRKCAARDRRCRQVDGLYDVTARRTEFGEGL